MIAALTLKSDTIYLLGWAALYFSKKSNAAVLFAGTYVSNVTKHLADWPCFGAARIRKNKPPGSICGGNQKLAKFVVLRVSQYRKHLISSNG
jgi:hypothetical protein